MKTRCKWAGTDPLYIKYHDNEWGIPLKNAWKNQNEIPSKTKESMAMSVDLKKGGFKFAGPVICYAFMQATGMVNDHTVDCFRYQEI